MKLKNKTLTVVVAVIVTIFTITVTSALGTETQQMEVSDFTALKEAVNQGDSNLDVTLKSDIESDWDIVVGDNKKLSLDLNGHHIILNND